MKKLDIVFDNDGVKGMWLECALKKYNQEYGAKLKREDVFTGNLSKVVLPGTDIMKYTKDKAVFRQMEAIPEAQALIRKLSKFEHRIFSCTAVSPSIVETRAKWTKVNYPEIDESRYIFTSDKSLVGGDVFIDDGLHNLVACKADVRILLSRPWNMNVSDKYKDGKYAHALSKIIRVSEETAYDDIFEIIWALSCGNGINKDLYESVFKEECLDEEKRLA